MKVAIVFEGDTSQPDPDAGHPEGIVRGEFLPAESDVLIFFREWGEQFKGGSRIHMLGGGAWENVTLKQMKRLVRIMESLR